MGTEQDFASLSAGQVRAGEGSPALFAGPGGMRALCRTTNWSRTPLGPPEKWSNGLRTAAELVLASPTAMVLLWGPELVQIYNDAYRDLSGPDAPATLGLPFDRGWTELWAFSEPVVGQVLTRGEAFRFDGQRLEAQAEPDRVSASFMVTYAPVRDDDGRLGGVLLTLLETGSAPLGAGGTAGGAGGLLEDLEASERKYRTLFESIDEGFCVIEMIFDEEERPVDYRFIEGNPAFVEQTGLVDPIGRTARELVPGLEEHWFEIYGRVAITGEAIRFQNGSDPMGRWFNVYAFRIGDPADRRVALLFTNVTKAREAEREREQLVAELEAERERLRSLILQVPAPLAMLSGPEHRFEVVNDAYRHLARGRELVGRTIRDAFPELEGQGLIERYSEVYESGEPWVSPHTRVTYDRGRGMEERWFDLRCDPMRTPEGMVVGILNFAVDITDQVLARREVERLLSSSESARAEAESANRAKSEFLAVMSHELRTPLNAISGYADLLAMEIHGPINEAQRKALTRIQVSQEHLLGLINEVLSYAKLERGSIRYEIGTVRVREMFTAIEAMVEPQARDRGISLKVADCPPHLQVCADPDKLRQILLNLLSNAVKFTDPGGRVEMSCERREGSVHLRVKDTGIGVPADKLETIFEAFVQVRSDLTRTAPGTGLGLAISRDLARGMKGDIRAESSLGEGSTFTVLLPEP